MRWLAKNMFKLIFFLSIIVMLFIFMGSVVKPFFFIGLFLFLSSISLIYNRWVKTSLGFEFITLSTVLTGRVYGPWAGALVGLVGLSAAEVIGTGFNAKTVISLATIFIMGLFVPVLNNMPILWAGMVFVVVYDAIILPLYMVAGSSPLRSVIFFVTHVIFNLWLFAYIAPILESLMR